LTSHLAARSNRVVGIEVDPVLVQYLRSKFRGEQKVEIIENDILKVDLAAWGRVVVAGNLPYYITSPIIEKVLLLRGLLVHAVFLVQREVAERLAASPGRREFGYLSVQTQLLAEVEVLFPLPAAAFRPVPKVDSAVVRLTPRAQLAVEDTSAFLKFAAAAFHQKRKTLRNNLVGRYDRAKLDARPETKHRAEQLGVSELIDLWRLLES
jgi:16S rRNA (adenine1518-N6/adenine1519-N6)-dimethyltransferase